MWKWLLTLRPWPWHWEYTVGRGRKRRWNWGCWNIDASRHYLAGARGNWKEERQSLYLEWKRLQIDSQKRSKRFAWDGRKEEISGEQEGRRKRKRRGDTEKSVGIYFTLYSSISSSSYSGMLLLKIRAPYYRPALLISGLWRNNLRCAMKIEVSDVTIRHHIVASRWLPTTIAQQSSISTKRAQARGLCPLGWLKCRKRAASVIEVVSSTCTSHPPLLLLLLLISD